MQDTNSTPPTETPTPDVTPAVTEAPAAPIETLTAPAATETAAPTLDTAAPIAPTPEVAPAPEATAAAATPVATVQDPHAKNFMVALLLSIFLGNLGIDRFYLGHIGLGVAKLLLGWATLGIWWLVDVILIATKKVKNVTWES